MSGSHVASGAYGRRTQTANANLRTHPLALRGRIATISAVTVRISIGWVFLWAFLDKLLGLGFATASANAWVRGGSPTYGFLTFGTQGPFAPVFQAMAGNPIVDALFMAGLLGIGLSFIFGVGMWIGAVSGAAMMVFMWLAALPPANNPFMDDHLVYAAVMMLLAALRAGNVFGLGRWWQSLEPVSDKRWLH